MTRRKEPLRAVAVIAVLAAGIACAGVPRASDVGGDLTFHVSGDDDVVFRHATHVEKGGLSCSACHPGIYAKARGAARYTMSAMRAGASCGSCHDGEKVFGMRRGCVNCHRDNGD